MVLKKYTKEEYLTTTAPYEALEKCQNSFEKEQMRVMMADNAKAVGVKNFTTLYKEYIRTVKKMGNRDYVENACNFEGQELELDTGDWTADDYGIMRIGYQGQSEVACPHPLMPVLRLDNIDSGIEKIKLAYKKGHVWKYIICDRRQIASNNKIVDLADYGIAVTTETSRNMVKYLHDVENLNFDKIPAKKSVSRLGWVGDEGFSPYVKDLVFDGEATFKTFFESVTQKGSFDKWIKLVKGIRAGSNIAPKIVLATSFASALVGPCNCLPFFVHLWGGTETGKTVGLMLAASVWANPEMGKFIHTFNSTAVAQELSASFVNSLPLILDELQIVKDKKDFDQMIYQLAEGVGKSRGQKTGGLQRTGTWNNCIITSGEQPITSGSSGGGAVNRIIEINCEDERIFEDPTKLVQVIKNNYGHAGRIFIEALSNNDTMEQARQIQANFYKEINKKATEKQSLAASIILTADLLIDELIFKDGQCISFDDIQKFLSNKDEVSVNKRAYEWIWDWVDRNKAKFISGEDSGHVGEIYGKTTFECVYIIKEVFDEACGEKGFNARSFLGWMKKEGLIDTDSGEKRFTKKFRINGSNSGRVALKNPETIGNSEVVDEQIEF